ncbi:thiamine phosphate synthase [Siminovitchia sp. FSL H7-0308]|uniref:Thiamine-phosphate synthase n=1 Tax=Siminovitchia thermophila TaxID=1245522 RepID=A0ABS2R9M8_9BACI|nr:thiamine phosphate synthase [Siminovitchia thermophila]MBM7716346.1 thiamine-phosphate pyrophosphorylase [Siminovitchia thermophila]ONK22013.1 thiamine-phosphate diphosphorylase [Bacillus sp. VT-16-64]
MKKNHIDYRLYLVTEEDLPISKLLHLIEESVAGGVTLVQLREKKSGGRDFYEKAIQIKKLLDSLSVPLIINDRVDVALAVGADGVHVGQEDLPLAAVKSIIPDSMLVGVSARTLEHAIAAEKGGADYIGVGSVFPTSTKSDAKLLPNGMLDKIVSSVSIPVVAIGGINEKNSGCLKNSGVAGIVVVSALTRAKNPKVTAENLLKGLKGFDTH